jgi:hypothetical protein
MLRIIYEKKLGFFGSAHYPFKLMKSPLLSSVDSYKVMIPSMVDMMS